MSFRKNVFVLGAGFSKEAGAPLMDEFLRCARDLRDDPKSELNEHDREIFDRVIQYRYGLNRALAKVVVDLDNIEELFGFTEMDLQLSHESEVLPGNRVQRKDMTYLIARTLEASIRKPLSQCGETIETRPIAAISRSWRHLKNQYSFFLGLVSGLWNPEKREAQIAKDSIISFNYDLVLEREMDYLKLAPEYNCGPLAVPYAGAFAGHELRVNLLKMHGSVNWVVCHRCGSDRLHFLNPETAQVSKVETLPCPQCNQIGLTQFIVPPTWNKGIEEKFLRPVWSAALQEMMKAGRLFIIGYSFPRTDQFFKYMLGLALAENDNLSEVYIVNPSEEVNARFKGLFHQYFHQRVVKPWTMETRSFIPNVKGLTHQEFDQENLGASFEAVHTWRKNPDGSATLIG